MKKIKSMSILLVCILTGLLVGCKTTKEASSQFQIYYPDRQYNRLVAEEYEGLEGVTDVNEQVELLLDELARPATDADHVPVISEFRVLGYELGAERISINLSEEYSLLEPTREVLVRAALVKTLTQLESVVFVSFQINGASLLDSLGEPVGVMNENTFIDNTGENMKNYEETEIILYFANEAGDGLIKVNRKLMYNTNTSKEKLVVEQLIRGPLSQNSSTGTQVYATLNPEIGIISVNVQDGICYVNLDDNFLLSVYTANADTVIYSLVNSLTELPGIRKVQISVEGETSILFLKKYDLGTLFEARPDLVQVVEGEP